VSHTLMSFSSVCIHTLYISLKCHRCDILTINILNLTLICIYKNFPQLLDDTNNRVITKPTAMNRSTNLITNSSPFLASSPFLETVYIYQTFERRAFTYISIITHITFISKKCFRNLGADKI